MFNPTLKYHFLGGITLETKEKDFFESVQFVQNIPQTATNPPIKLEVVSTGMQLFYDQNKFNAFVAGEISQYQLIAETQCDGLFRNALDIQLSKEESIDSGSLWYLKEGFFILADDDRFAKMIAPDSNFKKI